MPAPLLETRQISKHFRLDRNTAAVQAVEQVSISLQAGETLGLVGESGCGKTTLSRLLLLLEKPDRGAVYFKGKDSRQFSATELGEFRRSVQPVFQNPDSSLNPRMRVRSLVGEPLRSSRLTRGEQETKICAALEKVGLSAPDISKFPHEFSGGQRQRVAIARAIVSEPQVIILDEAVSSQDISIQAQILNLLKDLQQETGMAYVFISHDLATVRFLCDSVSVMYAGRVLESCAADQLFDCPQHPYTQLLLASCLPDDPDQAVPAPQQETADRQQPVSGCRFAHRCEHVSELCRTAEPPLFKTAGEHAVACVLSQPQSGKQDH